MALISALASGLVSTCERRGSRYGGGGGWGLSADWPDLPCQRHNPCFSAWGWRSEPCLPNLRTDLFPKPRDASVSFCPFSQLAAKKKKSVGLHQIGTTEINLSHASFGDILYPPPSLTFLLFRFGLCVQSCVAQNATFLLQQPPLRPQVRGGGIGTLVHL